MGASYRYVHIRCGPNAAVETGKKDVDAYMIRGFGRSEFSGKTSFLAQVAGIFVVNFLPEAFDLDLLE
jgi:hypothetical protein